ncbi:MAG: T9SS type A sorting domain-containing protein [Salinivirgaceae bacterium]|nr:T9SS type A sorting domain-containing protein [Salinivirgaceae bacterium]
MSANIGAISLNDTTTKKGDFIELQADGTYISGAKGEPQLPALRKLVQMPLGAKPEITIKHADTTVYALSDLGIDRKLSPRQPSQSKSGKEQKFKYKKRSYRHDYFTQNELVTIRPIGSMRGVEICQVNVNPVRYNPKQNTLMVLSNIEFDVNFDSKSGQSGANGSSPYFENIYTTLDNHKNAKSEITDHPVKYLIITDTAFVDALSDFIKWKRQKGFNVVVATTDTLGNFANDIKEWVSTQYHSATDDNPAPSFLLLAADTDKIPTSQTGSSSGYGTDLYYACMDGNDDIIPDIYYGRFSARTAAQMKAIADKTIAYEKYQFEDPSYLAKATLIAGYDGSYRSSIGIPTVDYIANNRINEKNGYSTVNKYTTSYTDCYSDMSVSVGLMTYTAHGETTSWVNPQLTQSDVRSFGNQGQFPFVVANCCLSGQFTKDECLGETWLRCENSGAVAYIGSSPKTYWDPDFFWAVGAHHRVSGEYPDTSASTTGAFDVPFVSDYVCGGAIMFTGNMAVTEAWDEGYYDDKRPLYYWEGYNYLGDPSLLVYFGEAKENPVSHNITIPVNSSSVIVNASSGSYIAISQNGELLGASYVKDGESSANISIKPVSIPCDIDVVVTKPRHKPYFGTITALLPDKSYLTIMNNPFKNRTLWYGGSANFDVVVSNLGQQESQSATISITSTSPFVKNVRANQTTLSPIGCTSSCTIANLCHIELNEDIADGTKIPFRFTIYENEETTSNEYTLNVTAPKLKLDATATIDKPNGQMLPGETADIIIPITNIGHERIDFATVKLTAIDEQPLVQVISSEQTISNLSPGDTAICRFTISADEQADMMTIFDFKVTALASKLAHSDSSFYTVTIGKLEDKIIGTGTSTAYNYPFYNYYKTSRTQILYTASDLGNKPIRIEELAFQFSSITQVNSFGGFKDLTIKIKPYSSNDLDGLQAFVDMSNAETVLKIDLMNLENNDLNLKFDKPFVYNGKSNLLMEIGWGQNINYIEKKYTPDIYCHYTETSTVIYGIDDYADCPDEISRIESHVSKRPNTIFRYQKPKYVVFDVKDNEGQPIANVEIEVDGRSKKTDSNGEAILYAFTNKKIEYKLNSIDYAVLQEEMSSVSKDTVHFSLQLQHLNVFAVTFHVFDSATHTRLTNAKVTIGNMQLSTNELGIATFDKIPNRPLEYTIEADNYISITKAFLINTDTLLSVGIVKKPWITFNIHTDSTPHANIGVNISNSVIFTDSIGMATHTPQRFDTIPYSIDINKITITDTIFNLRKPTAVDINLALIDTVAPTLPQPGDTNLQRTHTIVFCLSDGLTPIDSVQIMVNGIEKNTDSTGCALFDRLTTGTTITYTICKDGYETTDGHKSLTDSIICTDNSIIRVTLRKQANTSNIYEYQSDINIYPNPSDGIFTIENIDNAKISLFNIDGKLLKTIKITNSTIDLRPIDSGLYTLVIETPNGSVSTQIVIR